MVEGAGRRITPRMPPRMTLPTQLVLQVLLAEPTREMHGLQICRAANVPDGTIHAALARLEGCGWLESRWEDIAPGADGRPRRRYYRLSPGGVEYAPTALARMRAPRTLRSRLRCRFPEPC